MSLFELSDAAIEQALMRLLNTDSWDETHAVLKQEQPLLLTDQADQMITLLIEQHEHYNTQEHTHRANYLSLHRTLLRRARMGGIPRAWKWFELELQGQEVNNHNLISSAGQDNSSSQILQEIHAAGQLEDPERAIIRFEELLKNSSLDTDLLLDIYFFLAHTYMDRRANERKANIEQAIFYFEAALQIANHEALLEKQTILQVMLGNAYTKRIEGTREENLKQAVSHYNTASDLYTQNGSFYDYAGTQHLLGETYEEEVAPGQIFDPMMAISSYTNALTVFTLDPFPQEYAQTQWQLGKRYWERTGLERRDNIEKAIACYNAALLVFTVETEPMEYATINMNLGMAYAERIVGTLQENKENAIFFLERAVQTYPPETPPEEKARALSNLGNGYRSRTLGDIRTNLEKAIASFEEALHFCSLDHFPEQYAMVQFNLGSAYFKRIDGKQRVNLEKAIRCYEAALQVYTHDVHPLDYALTQIGLGEVYQKRLEEEHRINIEQAISHYEAALEVYTPVTYPQEYTMVMTGLCNAYLERTEGWQKGNIEQAILGCVSTFFICNSETFPQEWAHIRYCLGRAYMRRTAGERSDNFERAITYYREALEVYTYDAFPEYYANIQTHLSIAYKDRVKGERDENLEQALASQSAVLQIYTRDAFPHDYADLQCNRGHAYRERLRGERTANLEYAIVCYKEALQVNTLEAFPRDYRLAHIGLALAEGERQNWAEVHAACTCAHQASELLVQLASGEAGRDAVLKENFDFVHYDGFALAHLGRFAEAAVALEQGRAQGLAEALKLKNTDPDRIRNTERRQRYKLAHQQFVDAQSELHRSFSADIPRNEQRTLLLERAKAYQKAKETLDNVLTEIDDANDPKNFVNDTLDAAGILNAAESLGPGHALVYLASTPWGGIAIAAFSGIPSLSLSAHFASFNMPRMTDIFVYDLIQTEFGRRTDQIIGGFFHAQLGHGLSLLSNREWLATHEEPHDGFAVLAKGWEDETFRQRALSLHKKCKVSGQTSSLDKAVQTILNNPALASLVDQPLKHMKDDERNLLANTLNHSFLSVELQANLDALSAPIFRPLIAWLREQGTTSLTLIPCGRLAALPLTAVLLDDGRTIGETIPTSIVPSARSLLQNQETPKAKRSGVYAIGDPWPTHQQLPWGEAEALTIGKLARTLRVNGGGQVKIQRQATSKWFSNVLQQGEVVDASCHGVFDSENFLQSSLLLARGKRLPLGSLLSHEVDLRGLRLLILSACQTAVLDLNGAVNEVRSLAVGMLQSGARAVLASLWSVDDRATYLLIVRFAQEWFPHINDEPPAAALARAQRWLRTVTNRELLAWEAKRIPAITAEERQEAGAEPILFSNEQEEVPTSISEKKLAVVRGRGNRYAIDEAVGEVRRVTMQETDLDACPYADPIYWAAFQVTGW